jgi:NAD(P)H-hydrate epimerase
VLAGRGGNGGGALVAARRLHAWGFRVSVILTADEDIYTGVPAHQLGTIAAMRLPIVRVGDEGMPSVGGGDKSSEDTPTLILDGLIGYSLDGPPRKAESSLIQLANAALCPVLSLDVPSGLDAFTGEALDPCVEADATLTLALPKTGLHAEGAEEYVGRLYLGDIGVPPAVYSAMGVDLPRGLFAEGEILRVG